MADNHSKEIRSFNMSRIRSKHTKPEVLVRKILFSKGFRYKIHDKALPGKPDLVFPKYKTVVFIHGCFWHAHSGCKYFVIPKSNQSYWTPKIEKNAVRDATNEALLEEKGWNVIVIWECELKPSVAEATLMRVVEMIKG